jgi:hypothetical protein
MSGGTAPPLSKLAETPPPRRPSRHDGFIDKRLRQTRRQVKSADLWAGLIILAGGTLLYLLAAVVVDRWLIPGGLGFGGRLLLFVALIAAAAAYLALWMVPLVARRINPVFAAYAIEQGWPSLKNSLINLLYLRRERRETQQDELAKGIYRALERKAAADLAQIPPEATVDRSHVIRLACLLAGVLLVCCLYLAVWPKTTMVSFRRVIWPWAEVPPPTRVTIDDVQPGDAVAYQGDVLTVSAVVDGLDDDDQVALYYTTADGQCVDQAVPLTRPKGAYRHSCELPPGRLGLQQNVQYYLAAGDCRTRPFGLEVQTALSIQVDRVEYDYPDYTGIPNRVDRRVADLRAVEGTEVTLRATASQLIDRAAVEMDCDPRHALKMTVEDSRTASARFNLSMSRNDPTRT